MLPLRRPRYKRCSRTFNVTISPHMAEAVESFEDTPLSEYLQDQLAVGEGEDVEAEVHLYEVLPGGTAARHRPQRERNDRTRRIGRGHALSIAAAHARSSGGAAGRPCAREEVAAGRRTSEPSWAGSDSITSAIANRRPLTARGRRGRRNRVRRLARVYVTLDHTQDVVRVCVFLSEVKAQRLAVRLRQQSHAGSLTVGFHKLLSRRLPPILHGKRRKRLKIVHTAVPPGSASDSYLGRLPTIVPPAFVDQAPGMAGAGDLPSSSRRSRRSSSRPRRIPPTA